MDGPRLADEPQDNSLGFLAAHGHVWYQDLHTTGKEGKEEHPLQSGSSQPRQRTYDFLFRFHIFALFLLSYHIHTITSPSCLLFHSGQRRGVPLHFVSSQLRPWLLHQDSRQSGPSHLLWLPSMPSRSHQCQPLLRSAKPFQEHR